MTLDSIARAVATFVVATVAALSALSASPAPAEADDTGCGSGVTVVVDGNELGGEPRMTCVRDGGTASELFSDAGFPLEYQHQLQDFVCKVDGLPTDRPCTDGDSYWSLWWAEPSGEWVYATLGVGSLEVPAGGLVGFAWHEGEGEATPPDVEVGDAEVIAARSDAADESSVDDDRGGISLWLAGALVALVLGAATLVLFSRRRLP